MQDIRVYTKKRCPYCVASKIWLSERNYIFEEISLDIPEDQSKFISENPGLKTVPQIFISLNEEYIYIGGFTELIKSHYFKND